MKKLRSVVVGTGFIGPVHVEALRRAGVSVAGIVGSTPEKSRSAATQLGLPDTFATLDDVLSDSSVDAVHLTTPNALHFQQAKSVLAAGKHCMCEKPLAMNSQQSADLVDLAKQNGLAAGVAHNIRFYPLCHDAAERIRLGQIGDVLHVNGSYVQDWLLNDTDFNWRVMAEQGGQLRAVADIGTHWLDLVQFVTGKQIVAVCADLRTIYPERFRPVDGVETFSNTALKKSDMQSINITTEDCGAIMLRFADGANGCLWVSQTTAGRKNCLRFEVAGSKAAMHWNSETPNQLWIGHRDKPNQQLLRDPSLMTNPGATVASYPGGHNEGFPDTFKQLFTSFYRYIDAGDFTVQPPFPTFSDGHHEILLCEAILKSHQQQAWVSIPTPTDAHQFESS